jgi:hypothetical protein
MHNFLYAKSRPMLLCKFSTCPSHAYTYIRTFPISKIYLVCLSLGRRTSSAGDKHPLLSLCSCFTPNYQSCMCSIQCKLNDPAVGIQEPRKSAERRKFHFGTGWNASYRHLNWYRRAPILYRVKYRSIPANTGQIPVNTSRGCMYYIFFMYEL